ncbi:hypothetical protein [Phaffia rhodozyma]|uniref:Uncharacterized protein n=1 Tax=Phaffia rhodozyma TaxID=264483 RepID=A0A0F7SNY0_PHARH|nr:hypothetical protein [Phaffia rhodozyma]
MCLSVGVCTCGRFKSDSPELEHLQLGVASHDRRLREKEVTTNFSLVVFSSRILSSFTQSLPSCFSFSILPLEHVMVDPVVCYRTQSVAFMEKERNTDTYIYWC